MEVLELLLGERTFHEPTLSVTELAVLVVSPVEEGSVIEGSHTMAFAADYFIYMERLNMLIKLIMEL